MESWTFHSAKAVDDRSPSQSTATPQFWQLGTVSIVLSVRTGSALAPDSSPRLHRRPSTRQPLSAVQVPSACTRRIQDGPDLPKFVGAGRVWGRHPLERRGSAPSLGITSHVADFASHARTHSEK